MLIIEGSKKGMNPVMMNGGLTGRKAFEMSGQGFFDDLGRLIKRGVRTGVRQGKQFLPSLAKQLAPTVLSVLSSQGAKALSDAGVPDFAVNAVSSLGQQAARRVEQAPTPKLNPQQQAVSGFINKQSEQLLQNLLAKRAGAGVRPLGARGIRRLGEGYGGRSMADIKGFGVRRFGSGLTERSAKRLN